MWLVSKNVFPTINTYVSHTWEIHLWFYHHLLANNRYAIQAATPFAMCIWYSACREIVSLRVSWVCTRCGAVVVFATVAVVACFFFCLDLAIGLQFYYGLTLSHINQLPTLYAVDIDGIDQMTIFENFPNECEMCSSIVRSQMNEPKTTKNVNEVRQMNWRHSYQMKRAQLSMRF